MTRIIPLNLVEAPRDTLGRPLRDLRISVIDRCNFRCPYCMPEDQFADDAVFLSKNERLRFEEIERIARAFVASGVRKLRLTGGEPLLRRELPQLVGMLRRIPQVEDIALTTNGVLLPRLAAALREAGLMRLTVSLDTLDEPTFRKLSGGRGEVSEVLAGIAAAEEAGFGQIKLNCVVMRGVNDDEVADFARLTLDRRVTVRFIEYMPLGDAAVAPAAATTSATPDSSETGPAGGCGAQDRGDVFVSEPIVRRSIEDALGPLAPVERSQESGVGPAVVYHLSRDNPRGRVGFISAMSAPFCSTCNRLRLTATGVLRSCLFEGGEVDLKPILREPAHPASRQQRLGRAMEDCVRLKPDVHSARGHEQMSRIGG